MDSLITIKIKDLLIVEMSREEGAIVRSLILQLWNQCENIVLDFKDVTFASISFLDEAIAKIFLDKPSNEVFAKLKIVEITETKRNFLISMASSRNKQFIKNKKEKANLEHISR
ncbi:MAG: STAS-like domain-containing protein [Candidatus Hatepunaea meridiana]|nr:STAS-like domain-containing protein [Candidatus Hatepunaea meridiana]